MRGSSGWESVNLVRPEQWGQTNQHLWCLSTARNFDHENTQTNRPSDLMHLVNVMLSPIKASSDPSRAETSGACKASWHSLLPQMFFPPCDLVMERQNLNNLSFWLQFFLPVKVAIWVWDLPVFLWIKVALRWYRLRPFFEALKYTIDLEIWVWKICSLQQYRLTCSKHSWRNLFHQRSMKCHQWMQLKSKVPFPQKKQGSERIAGFWF